MKPRAAVGQNFPGKKATTGYWFQGSTLLLDRNIEQSNPSGLAALRLDDQVLESSGGTLIHVRAVIFPVRFGDFDQGTLESLLGPLIEDDRIDAFVSISMGRDAFDLERFQGGGAAPHRLII